MTLNSMTGFAARAGQAGGLEWQWEARSVNARGLDLRWRLPEGLEALETQCRNAVQARLKRGSVQIGLRLRQAEGAAALQVNAPAVAQVLAAAAEIGDAAEGAGVALAPASVGDILAMRGVLEMTQPAALAEAASDHIAADIAPLIDALAEARAAEGAALARVLAAQLDAVEALVERAAGTAEARAARQGEVLRARVAALLDAQDRVDGERLAQELALLAVKADVTEEIDRLRAHVEAARAMLAAGGETGRRLDFLMQEFNREANTLCSKAQDAVLTAIGLDLKVVIDQMREQSQNVE